MLRRDPCGITCIVFTYGLIFYADYVVISQIVMSSLEGSAWGVFHALCFNILIFLQLFAHIRTVLSDPGTVPLPMTGLDFSDVHAQKTKHQEEQALATDDWTVCQRCETYRPPRAHHCKICRRCIRRMDHHCPWVNNCVGESNQKYFIQFLFYTGILCAYALSLDISSWVWMVKDTSTDESFANRQSAMAHSIALCIESILFGLFVVAMFCDQMSSIFDDETAVEHVINKRKPRPVRSRKPKMSLVREVFGYGPVYCWIFPCSGVNSRTQPSFSYDV
ncbi:palmitoyltransferase ZDHHC7-like [Styela clava]|uniref:palmitoyltransferase ZDHHC7-like n=1 Tax=Styela clava TaxID=7725 RepID=UPI00193A4269|nr:palmitoyltransferase ZDHHC7-like [Styela clava]